MENIPFDCILVCSGSNGLAPNIINELFKQKNSRYSLRNSGFDILTFKDGAYYCYCAYVLRISRYSGFLLVVLTNTGMFLRSFELCGESGTQQVLLVSKKKIGGSHAFSRDN